MAFLQCSFSSQVLQQGMGINVILPDNCPQPVPVLFLLHGLSDDHTTWMRRTSIERYVSDRGIAVIMPSVHRSFYTDMASGGRYFTYISEELPQLCAQWFPITSNPAQRWIAGLSMGGYGAMKVALTHPERWGAVASLSGVLDIAWATTGQTDPIRLMEARMIFGDNLNLRGTQHDLLYLLSQQKPGKHPHLYACCGTEDFLYEGNLTFRDYCASLNIPLHYEEGPGDHSWGYWDAQIQSVLNWLKV